MNKVMTTIKSLSLLAVLGLSLTSCLKDEGFEKGTYGMTGFEGKAFVSIGKSNSNPNALALESKATVQDIGLFEVTYDNANAASEDIKVTIEPNAAAVSADASLTVLPAGALTIPNAEVTISKGKRVSGTFTVKMNTQVMDPTKVYGMAFSLKSVSKAGVQLTANLNTVLFKIAVKNRFDGNYTAGGYFYHPTAPRAFSMTKKVSTAGPNSVIVDLGDLGAANYKALITVNNDNTLTIEPAPGAAGAPYTMHTASLPATNPGYAAGWANSAQCNNTYDPATKTFKVRYGYMGGNGWRVTEELIVKQ